MISIKVAPTSANLGPGFDCLAVTLDLGDAMLETTFELGGDEISVTPVGWGENELPRDENNLIAKAFLFYAARLKLTLPQGLKITARNGIPIGSGLGSSAAAIISGLLAANAMYQGNASQADLLRMAFELEGHADNTTAALTGGLVLLAIQGDTILYRQHAIPRIPVIVVRPDFRLSTQAARAALPKMVNFSDAVMNIGQTALTVEALRTGEMELLGMAMKDSLHQPYRLPLIPGAEQAIQAGYQAGAVAVVLSGAGPSLLAITPQHQDEVAAAMQAAFQKAGQNSMVLIGWTANAPAQITNPVS